MSKKMKYKLEPPEGGWGYIITISMIIILMSIISRHSSFGLIYGTHISKMGNEASITSIINYIYQTFLSLMGLVVNKLLQKYSCRLIAALGSIISTLGFFLTAFCSTTLHMIITYSIIQGIGTGLMIPATYIIFNKYFFTKRNSQTIIAQTISAAVCLSVPYFITRLMDIFDYQGTIFIITALCLHNFAATLTFQPVKRHMIKVYFPKEDEKILNVENENVDENLQNVVEKSELLTEETAKKISTINKVWNNITSFLEISILKDPVFANIIIGISLVFLSDNIFISMLPMFLTHSGYKLEETANLMTIYMFADLVGKILLSIFTAFIKIKIKYIFLFGCTSIALFRIVFALYSDILMITILTLSVLGTCRSTIQVTPMLVLCEYSIEKFSAAYGLFLFISGISSIVVGQISSWVAKVTEGDLWIQNILTLLTLLCAIPWTIELIWNKIKKN